MSPEIDLFGQPITAAAPAPIADGKRRKTVPNGYAAAPGTGPAGQTCKTCIHLAHRKLGKTYLKCRLARDRWTGGAGTDIKANSPACTYWNGGIGYGYVRYEGKQFGDVRPKKALIVEKTDTTIESTEGTFKKTAENRWEWTWGKNVVLERIVMK